MTTINTNTTDLYATPAEQAEANRQRAYTAVAQAKAALDAAELAYSTELEVTSTATTATVAAAEADMRWAEQILGAAQTWYLHCIEAVEEQARARYHFERTGELMPA